MMEEAKERQNVAGWFKDAWGNALSAVSSAEEEAQKLLRRAGEMVGWSPEDVVKYAREFGERLISQRRELERTVEDRVKKAVARLRMPRREELEALRSRLDKLAERLDALKPKP